MNLTGWGHVPAHKPTNRKPHRRYFALSDGREVTASQLSRDPGNVHNIKRSTLHARLLRGMTEPEQLLACAQRTGRPPRAKRS
jgi:hypothetical protein